MLNTYFDKHIRVHPKVRLKKIIKKKTNHKTV